MENKEIALGKITEAKNNNSTVLDLQNLRLEEFPSEILSLTYLEVLFLDGNRFMSIPNKIQNLKALQVLNLGANNLKKFPSEILKLTNLKELHLYSNELTSIPSEIRDLKQLRGLWLESNSFSEFPTEILELRNLEILFLSGNQINNLPSNIQALSKLKELALENNNLKTIPEEVTSLTELKRLRLHGNPIDNPPLEISMRGIYSIRNYFSSIGLEDVKLYEAKVLIVGEGYVGKTWLLKRLLYDEVESGKLSTEGIEIDKKTYQIGAYNDFQINFWDFGGQEIYHSTHQFFLTKRSLYLFVWAARTDDDLTSFDYWLNIIKLLSNNAPVIVIQNKIDERIKNIDSQSLQEKFKNVLEFHNVSAANGIGIKNLLESIKVNVAKLDHIGSTLPKAWIDVRNELEKLPNNYISYNEYENICQKFKINKDRAGYLSEYFHDLGLFLHFKESEILREIIILKPEWATNAVYRLVDKKEIINNGGRVSTNDLRKYWDNDYFRNQKYLIELMKKFELCFELDDENYIIPELLSQSKPEIEWKYKDNLKVEYHYDFMPAGIIARFISRNHRQIKENLYWKNGVVITSDDTEALVVGERLNRKIKVWIRGGNMKSLFQHINSEISVIHRTLNHPDVKRMIPCQCDECKLADSTAKLYDYKELEIHFEHNQEFIFCVNGKQNVSIKDLLMGYQYNEPPRILKTETEKATPTENEKQNKERDKNVVFPIWLNLLISLGIPIVFIVALSLASKVLDFWKLPIIIIGSIFFTVITINFMLILTSKISPELHTKITNSVLGKLSILVNRKREK